MSQTIEVHDDVHRTGRLAVAGTGMVFASATGPLGQAIAQLAGVRPGLGPVTLKINPTDCGRGEVWTRRFGRRVRTSRIHHDDQGDLLEQIGPLQLRFTIRTGDLRTDATLKRLGVGRWSTSTTGRLAITCVSRRRSSLAKQHYTTVRIEVGRRPIGTLTYTVRIEVGP